MNFYKPFNLFILIALSSTSIYANSNEPLFKALTKPQSIGSYQLTVNRTRNKPQNYHSSRSNFKDSNKSLTQILPPPHGQYWVISEINKESFDLRKSGKSREAECNKIDWDNSSKDGIAVIADLGSPASNKYAKNKLANVTCVVRGPVNYTSPNAKPLKNSEQALFSSFSYPLNIPENMTDFELTIKIRGANYIVKSSDKNDLFSVSVHEDRIILVTF
jgi:hypothetical protein